MNSKIKKFLPAIILGGIALIYVVISIYFNNAFLPNTYFNNINYGGKTVSSVIYDFENQTEYMLTLEKNDGSTETITADKFDYKTKVVTDIQKIKDEQNGFTWLLSLFSESKHKVNLDVSYDEEKLTTLIKNLKCVTSVKATDPVNAYVSKTETGYEIVPEKNGSKINTEVLKEEILNAVANGDVTLNLSERDCYYKPEITTESPEIKNMMAVVEKLNTIKITFDFSDRKEELSAETISKWITIDKNNEIQVDESKAKQYIINLAAKYDTYQTDREFVTTDGKTITVGGGIYGWQTDVSASTKKLIETIKECESVTMKPEYTIECICRDTNDIGNTYVEISIEKQKMWYYKNGELLVETDVVTGLTNGKRNTPTGVFCIWSREKDRTISNPPVHVDYWMPIDWTGVGLHDASWRSSFGGNIYKSNGSHGCVNTPLEAIRTIFENTVTGTPVIIY